MKCVHTEMCCTGILRNVILYLRVVYCLKTTPQVDFAGPQRSVALYSARFHQVPAELWPSKVARTLINTLPHRDGAIGVSPG